MQKLNIPRCPLRKQVLTTAGLTDMMSGEGLALFAKLSLPDVGQTRRALLRLRREHRFSRGKLAALLAVSPQTLRRWEDGTRKPCASARRVVQLVERFYFRPGDFPTEPIDSVLGALGADFRDKTAALQQQLSARAASPAPTKAES